jgi:hypothetical protein
MRANANYTSSEENLALLLNQLQKVKQTGHDQGGFNRSSQH